MYKPKYRVLEVINELGESSFYTQRKGWFFWNTFGSEDGHSSLSYAKDVLEREIRQQRKETIKEHKVHNYDEIFEKLKRK